MEAEKKQEEEQKGTNNMTNFPVCKILLWRGLYVGGDKECYVEF